ncbi:MAG: ribonuclease J [Phyllobacteriaceae bacterium]|nr:ribonuclease J [Phyllobacteriaceae bacterium]
MNAKRRKNQENNLVLLPLGGIGEIGMNCYCYGVGPADEREWLMVDLGVKFGGDAEPGVDVILPDVGFITSNKNDLAGLVITHAHEDHIGAVPWLWPQLECDVHCTPFAAELLKLKLKEHGLDGDVPIIIHQPGKPFKVGSFLVEYVEVTHSIPQSHALYIKTELGKVLHSGDWKIDRTPVLGKPFNEKRFIEIGQEGVDVLVCDSTNVLREGSSPSERDVAATLADIIKAAPGRVAVTTFASHVERITSAVRAARAAGREVVIAGRAMRNTIEAARICGLLENTGAFLDEAEFGYLPQDKIMLLCTGSQGEPRAAIARIAEDSHQNIALEKGDLVIFSARTIPGNEKEVSGVINNLSKLEVDVITADEALIHSSGHPRQGELVQMYGWVKPRAVVPMHGEPRHLRAHAKFAAAQGIRETLVLEDGKIARLAPGPVAIVDEAPTGVLHVDGNLIVPGLDGPAKQRRKLSMVGMIIASVVVDDRQELADDIEIILDGVPGSMIDLLEEAGEKTFASIPKPRRKDDGALAETLRLGIRRAAETEWGKKPVVKVIVVRV